MAKTAKTPAAKLARNRAYLAKELRDAAEWTSSAQSATSAMIASWVATHATITAEEDAEARAIYAELNALHNRLQNLATKLAE